MGRSFLKLSDTSDNCGTMERPERTEKLRIRCTPETKRRFKVFVAEMGFPRQEAAIIALLELYEKDKRRARIIWS